ncbi:ZIP zinc transporter-domain-containing protein [Limtongia smithiae]|uniref:ZIP zinc transporter-domain-containing protein n=1 Tax=Limtongia smithiae TaxID=1125753 RepID=UPI0034CF4740
MAALTGLLSLFILVTLMALASFGAGMLPLVVALRPDRLRLVSAAGTGVLVGTSLIVIIPEGVETLYTAAGMLASQQRGAVKRPGAFKPPTLFEPPTGEIGSGGVSYDDASAPREEDGEFLPTDYDVVNGTAADEEIAEKEVSKEEVATDEDVPESVDDEAAYVNMTVEAERPAFEDDATPYKLQARLHTRDATTSSSKNELATHKVIGVALVAGFIFMYLVDKLPPYFGGAVHHHVAAVDVSELRSYSVENGGVGEDGSGSAGIGAMSSLTTGFVIHAAADGIALGASAASESVALALVIFLAVLIHKAPTAFSMTAVLLRSGLARRAVKQQLIVFSLAAPVGALVTWVVIMIVGSTAANTTAGASGVLIQWWTGVLLLLSGGAFLYVAVQVMNESADVAGKTGGGGGAASGGVRMTDTAATLAGMLVPLVTMFVRDV